MVTVEFINEGISLIIQYKPEDKMSEICSQYARKSQLDLNSIYFVSEGKILNKELTFSETTKTDSIKVLVFKHDKDPIVVNLNKTIPKFIMCPTCKENTIINIENDKITMSGCRNGHELKNNLFNEFKATQEYDMTLIKCQKW